ncbi:CHAD domain-containing protein [Rhizobium sp.]
MKYSLDLRKPLEDEVRRIASGRLDEAAALLRDQPDGLDDAIHDARRHIKQCRALYRLVRDEARDFQKVENARLGNIGRQLSAMRDAKALIEATDYLRREIPTKSNGMLMDRLAKRLDQRREAMTGNLDDAARSLAFAERELAAASAAANSVRLPRSPRKCAACLAKGWEAITRKARLSIEAAADGAEEGFHDLRKRAQDRWMHAALLRDLWPTAMTAIQRQGKTLSDLLGHAQDLDILVVAVSNSDDLVSDSVETEAIRDAALAQQKKLHGECLDFAREHFGKSKPRDGVMIERLLRER